MMFKHYIYEAYKSVLYIHVYTVGNHTPCKLSFVCMSYIRYGVGAAPKFGKHESLFSYHKEKNYIKAIIYSIIHVYYCL